MGKLRIHFMGIGGAGVSAVSAFAKEAGFEVSGCDIDSSSQFLQSLKKIGIKIFPDHNKSHLEGVDRLVISPAIESLDPNNPELLAAKEKKLKIDIAEKFLAEEILTTKKVIAVTGTHGKSTTTAMVSKILVEAGLDPNCFVGAIVAEWGSNFRIGKGEYFVIEADEYQEKFLLYQPVISIITSIEMDHPEFFSDFESLKNAFLKFAQQTKQILILGKGINLDPKQLPLQVEKLGENFTLNKFELKLIGEFNQENATLAFEVAKVLKIDEKTAKEALERFTGINRRLEFKGEKKGVKVFDDYGHHPTAIKTVMEAAKNRFPNQKIWLVYQPHMYTRTKHLFDEFVKTFVSLPIHETLLVDIFAARQENRENISSEDLVKACKKENVKYIGDFEKTAYYLVKKLSFGDIVIVMGAGDIYKLSNILLTKLENHG